MTDERAVPDNADEIQDESQSQGDQGRPEQETAGPPREAPPRGGPAVSCSGRPWSPWLWLSSWISSALSGTALSSVMSPECDGHPASLDVKFPCHIRFVQHCSEHQFAGQRLTLHEPLERRHGGHDLRSPGDAQLDPRRVLVARLLAEIGR